MFDKSWLLPPNEWDPSIILDPPAVKFDRLGDFRKAGKILRVEESVHMKSPSVLIYLFY